MKGELSSLSGRLMDALSLTGELVVLNFAMLLCCLPVITAGASVSAGCAVAQKMLRGEQDASIFKEFFLRLRRNFAQATGLWLAQLVASAVFGGDIYYAVTISESRNTFFLVFGIAGLLLVFALSLWAYPLQSRYENSLGGHIKNAALLAVLHFPKTLLLMLLWLLPLSLTLFVPEILKAAGWIWMLCGFAGLQYLSAAILRPVLDSASGSGAE